MAENLRNMYKRSELAWIQDEVGCTRWRDLCLEQIRNYLIANNLSIRGTTTDQAERLIWFEIREQDPNATVRWDSPLDLATGSVEQDSIMPAPSVEDDYTIRERPIEEAAINTIEIVEGFTT